MNAPHAQQAIDHARNARDRVLGELRKVIVGQEELIDQVFIAMCAGGHVLLVGVPGLAKTLLVSTLAKTLSMHFKRIQFTPDMMPSDITGTEILEEDHSTGKKQFVFVQGPVFTNLLLADEINRTPPKTQAALLEAMQEKSITVGKKTYKVGEGAYDTVARNLNVMKDEKKLEEGALSQKATPSDADIKEMKSELTMDETGAKASAAEEEVGPSSSAASAGGKDESLEIRDGKGKGGGLTDSPYFLPAVGVGVLALGLGGYFLLRKKG